MAVPVAGSQHRSVSSSDHERIRPSRSSSAPVTMPRVTLERRDVNTPVTVPHSECVVIGPGQDPAIAQLQSSRYPVRVALERAPDGGARVGIPELERSVLRPRQDPGVTQLQRRRTLCADGLRAGGRRCSSQDPRAGATSCRGPPQDAPLRSQSASDAYSLWPSSAWAAAEPVGQSHNRSVWSSDHERIRPSLISNAPERRRYGRPGAALPFEVPRRSVRSSDHERIRPSRSSVSREWCRSGRRVRGRFRSQRPGSRPEWLRGPPTT